VARLTTGPARQLDSVNGLEGQAGTQDS
jgi:hypothetical protein